MWQIICLCLPTMTKEQRQRFLTLFGDVIHTYNRELGEVDLGLSFLYTLTPAEALTVLEERLDLVEHSRTILDLPPENELTDRHTMMQHLVHDHIRTLLDAERQWLQRSIQYLRVSENNNRVSLHIDKKW